MIVRRNDQHRKPSFSSNRLHRSSDRLTDCGSPPSFQIGPLQFLENHHWTIARSRSCISKQDETLGEHRTIQGTLLQSIRHRCIWLEAVAQNMHFEIASFFRETPPDRRRLSLAQVCLNCLHTRSQGWYSVHREQVSNPKWYRAPDSRASKRCSYPPVANWMI